MQIRKPTWKLMFLRFSQFPHTILSTWGSWETLPSISPGNVQLWPACEERGCAGHTYLLCDRSLAARRLSWQRRLAWQWHDPLLAVWCCLCASSELCPRDTQRRQRPRACYTANGDTSPIAIFLTGIIPILQRPGRWGNVIQSDLNITQMYMSRLARTGSYWLKTNGNISNIIKLAVCLRIMGNWHVHTAQTIQTEG